MRSSEIGGSAGLVDEDEFRGIKIELGGEPVPALLQNIRAPLLLGVRGLFLNVTPWRSKKRQSTETEKRSPQFCIRRSWISSSVRSGVRRIKPSKYSRCASIRPDRRSPPEGEGEICPAVL
jgi:hypothetical protein